MYRKKKKNNVLVRRFQNLCNNELLKLIRHNRYFPRFSLNRSKELLTLTDLRKVVSSLFYISLTLHIIHEVILGICKTAFLKFLSRSRSNIFSRFQSWPRSLVMASFLKSSNFLTICILFTNTYKIDINDFDLLTPRIFFYIQCWRYRYKTRFFLWLQFSNSVYVTQKVLIEIVLLGCI